MKSFKLRFIAFIVLACFTGMSQSGCAAGGYKFTRSLAKWNNSLSTVVRVIAYIVLIIIPVYLITLIVDLLIFNTIDFWEGTVSAQNSNFEKDGIQYAIEHRRDPLRSTTMLATLPNKSQTKIEIRELPSKKIELLVNGVRRAEVSDISELGTQLTMYKEDGSSVLLQKTLNQDALAQIAVPSEKFDARKLREQLGLKMSMDALSAR